MTRADSEGKPSADHSQVLVALLRAATDLVSILDQTRLYESLARHVVDVLPAAHAALLWLYDPQQGLLRPVATHGFNLSAEDQAALQRLRLRAGEGLPGLAIQQDTPLLITGRARVREATLRLSPRNLAIAERLIGQLPAATAKLLVPLRLRTDLVGVIELRNHGGDPGFSEFDQDLLQTFSNLAVSALKNTQLHQQTSSLRRRLEGLDAVATAVSTAADLDDLLRSVLEVLLAVVDTPAGGIFLLDHEQVHLALSAHLGLPPAFVAATRAMPITGSPCEEAVRYGQPTLRPLMNERGEGPLLSVALVHGAYLPLLAGGTVTGVLGLYGDGALPARVDLPTLMTLCNQIGFAVANVQLYEQSASERRQLNAVVSSIADGVMLFDRQGRLVLTNDAVRQVFGADAPAAQQTLAELRDRYDIRSLKGDPLETDELPFARALAGQTVRDERIVLHGASGPYTVASCTGAPTRDDEGNIEGAVVIVRDITLSQRMERAREEFLAVAAHELRSPLAAVRSYADLLLRREQRRGDEDTRDIRGLTILTEQVNHMLRMVDNLLDLSRLEAGSIGLEKEPIDLVAIIRRAIDQQKPAATEHTLLFESDVDELVVPCDALRVAQILTNLLSNALRYSPPGSTVRVLLTTLVDNQADGPDTPQRRWAQVCVMDQGQGIAEHDQAQLFQRYYRARNRRGEGLGLGLYLTRQFIQMHGGRIWFHSHEGQGSTFCFTLPLDDEKAEAAEPI